MPSAIGPPPRSPPAPPWMPYSRRRRPRHRRRPSPRRFPRRSARAGNWRSCSAIPTRAARPDSGAAVAALVDTSQPQGREMAIEERDLQLLLQALAFAARKHKDQRRKAVAASPYINHPISLAHILINEAHVTDIAVVCAALLHDTVEDTDTSPEELAREFGPAICDLVMAVTDDKTLLPHERKQRQIDHAGHISHQAKLVKLAD